MKPPHWSLALTEAPRALADGASLLLARRLLLKLMPHGHGQGVMVIPGFLGGDGLNQPLVKFLGELGYSASGWGQGRNLGPRSFSVRQTMRDLMKLRLRGKNKVALIGHSLGGIYARELARQQPELISQVITLGTPFGEGREAGSNASRLYQRLNPDSPADPRRKVLGTPPPVPTTAIYTRCDGVVNWRTSVQAGEHPQVSNIEVPGSHIGLTLNPMVWYWITAKLGEDTAAA